MFCSWRPAEEEGTSWRRTLPAQMGQSWLEGSKEQRVPRPGLWQEWREAKQA